MNKGKGIGIGIAVVAITIVFGIASLPDDVLTESPSTIVSPTENNPVVIPPIMETQPKETPSEEGKEITVNIKDGVGSGDK